MSGDPKLTTLGKISVILFMLGCLAAAWFYFRGLPAGLLARWRAGSPGASDGTPTSVKANTEIGVAYGTEKKLWLEWAAQQFATTDAGRRVKVNLLPMGSLEGSQALVAGDTRIHVWSPASRVYEGTFVLDWQARHGGNPILKAADLALTPMVFVWWDERYQAFARKYGTASFETIGKALGEGSGWAAIASKPEWGLFKIGHTHPNQSNSGLVTLLAIAHEYHQKTRGLVLADILEPAFQEWLVRIERGVSGLAPSTGTMMREMVLKGPSAFDVLVVYESVAIEYLKSAEGRWGSLHITYPERNFWNENPYYIIDATWSSADQRRAAEAFLEFLLSEPVQRQSLRHGFRPGDPTVPIKTPDSAFVLYGRYGLKIEPGSACEAPAPEVITNLLSLWQRQVGR